MNDVQAKRAVVLSLFGAGAVVILSKAATTGFPTDPRLYIAGAFMYVLLGFGAEFAPMIVGPLAILIFVSVLLYEGAPLFDGITKALGQQRQKRKGAKP